MMLVQLSAMDSVQSLSLADSLSSLPGPFTLISHLTKPSVLLTFLATLVILASIRAALLFMGLLPQQKGSVSLVKSVVVETDKVVADMIGTGLSPTSSVVKGKQSEKPRIAAPATMVMDKKTTSWFWGLLKWDSLPALVPTSTSFRNRINGVPMSETELSWQLLQRHRGRRPGPAFDHPLPALYQSDVPVSMAKMIMSRHTFRRPTSRPPPVHTISAPQYQRRTPSMV